MPQVSLGFSPAMSCYRSVPHGFATLLRKSGNLASSGVLRANITRAATKPYISGSTSNGAAPEPIATAQLAALHSAELASDVQIQSKEKTLNNVVALKVSNAELPIL